jgi:hypothetical protein
VITTARIAQPYALDVVFRRAGNRLFGNYANGVLENLEKGEAGVA